MTTKNVLTTIAQSLTDRVTNAAEKHPELIHVARWQLAKGLHLEIELHGGWYSLTLSRAGIAPSAIEVDVCRIAFNVPANALLNSGKCYLPNGRNTAFIRLKWHKYKQSSLLDLLQEEQHAETSS